MPSSGLTETPDGEPLLDPAVQADPFPYYQRLRETQPVLRMPGTGFYVLTRYEDLRAILRDTETYSNTLDLEELSGEQARRLGALFHQRLAEKGWPHVPTLHQSDPPEHTRYRRLLNKVFTPGRVRQMIPDVQRICDQLIDSFAGRGRCEFVTEFAFPLPGIVISEQLGLAAGEIGTFRRWADAMLAPAQGLFRKLTRDVDLHGVSIPAGSILHVRYGAANRTPRRSPLPARST